MATAGSGQLAGATPENNFFTPIKYFTLRILTSSRGKNEIKKSNSFRLPLHISPARTTFLIITTD